ncbi:MAG TPA: hypothetical protein VFN36_04735 [Solirubrobacteraceae bacterium]|nr:hypothetical protein [Solirubrobacteraceae bacterium]
MKQASLTLAVFAALTVPAHALAAPRMGVPLKAIRPSPRLSSAAAVKLSPNEQADRHVLLGYDVYLSALLAQVPNGTANDASFVALISSQCKGALTPLTQPPNDVSTTAQHTLTILGHEMGDDLSISFDAAALPAFTRFADVLAHQHWTRMSGASAVVRRYVNAVTTILAFTPSNLCLDASDAELNPDVVPDATRAFVPAYVAASREATAALAGLRNLMQLYEVPPERALIARISSLAAQLASQMKAALLQSGASLTSVLEAS